MAFLEKLGGKLPTFDFRELMSSGRAEKKADGKSGSVKSRSSESAISRLDLRRFIELAVFALTAPIVGIVLFSDDPLGISSGFAWAAVGPVIFAARYGVSWGASCALLAVVAILYPHAAYLSQYAQPIALAIGTLVLAVIVGDSSTNWRKRAGQASAENQYLRHRLKEFSNDYHVLKVSHGQLEEYMAGQKLSLRQALQQLKPVLGTNRDGMQAGEELMAVFAQFCSVQVAGLYTMKSDTVINPQAVAIHGNMGELPVFDKILNAAVKEKKLASIKLSTLADDQHADGLLAAVPIADSNGNLHGVLAIRDMHFMAFQQENLNLLSLLTGYIGDMLTRSRGSGQSQGAWFMAELETALRFARTHSVQSALLSLRLKRFDRDADVAEFISTNIRSLDASWQPKTKDGSYTVVILLPLVTEAQAEGYVARLVAAIQKEYGIGLDKIVRNCRAMQLDSSINQSDCLDFLQGKEVNRQAKARYLMRAQTPGAKGQHIGPAEAQDEAAAEKAA